MKNKEKKEIDILGQKRKKHKIFRGENFKQSDIIDFYDSEIGKKISAYLNERRFSLGSDKVTYRVINHWEKEGLLTFQRDSEKGWRRYSIIDTVWMEILKTLRNFGVSIQTILEVKKNLEMLDWKDKPTQFPFLEKYVALTLNKSNPVYVLVFQNGEVEPLNKTEYMATLDFLNLEDHITISLTEIVNRILPFDVASQKKKKSVELSEDELELLYYLRMKDFDSLEIKKRNGKIERFEITEKIDIEKRIIELLKQGDYQDINIKQAGGKVVNITRKTKKKL